MYILFTAWSELFLGKLNGLGNLTLPNEFDEFLLLKMEKEPRICVEDLALH